MGVVIDTSELVHIEREWMIAGRDLLPDLPEDGVIAAISLAELRMGALLAASDSRRESRDIFRSRVRDRLRVVPFGIAEAEIFADLMVSLRHAGTGIGERDLQIAATALAGGHQVLTRNVREFERVPGLDLYRA